MRVGKFSLRRDDVHAMSPGVREIMARCIVVRAEALFYENEYEYVALSDLFADVPEGGLVPRYTWEFSGSTLVSAVPLL